MAVEAPQNEEISGKEKNGKKNGVGSAIYRRRADKRGIHIKK